MSYITHSGYGYRKLLCEDVTSWFLNKFLPRHKIHVEIVHRGLKREQVYGYIKTLLHELTHLRQWVVGSLRSKRGKMYYGKECVEDIEYWYQPHEIEAREQEETLYVEYLIDKDCISEPKVIDYFPNRLMM